MQVFKLYPRHLIALVIFVVSGSFLMFAITLPLELAKATYVHFQSNDLADKAVFNQIVTPVAISVAFFLVLASFLGLASATAFLWGKWCYGLSFGITAAGIVIATVVFL